MKEITLEEIRKKIVNYQTVVILSFIFGALGFIYNNWRHSHNENNTNVRVASFQLIQELASLEQNIYANHYDGDMHKGSSRDGWVKVGLIKDLSLFLSNECRNKADQLHTTWQNDWEKISEDQNVTDTLVKEIDAIRIVTRNVLKNLY